MITVPDNLIYQPIPFVGHIRNLFAQPDLDPELWGEEHLPFAGDFSQEARLAFIEHYRLPDTVKSHAAANMWLNAQYNWGVSGVGTRFSQSRNWHADLANKSGLKFDTYVLNKGGLGILLQLDLVEYRRGEKALDYTSKHPRCLPGRQSTIFPREAPESPLLRLALEGPQNKPRREVLFVRDRASKKSKRFTETPFTILDRLQIEAHNRNWSGREFRLYTNPLIPDAHTVYTGDFEHGGREYIPEWDQLSKHDRLHLTEIITGKAYCGAILDVPAMHPQMLYKLAALPMPLGDPYVIPGWIGFRDIVKIAFNTLNSSRNVGSAAGAIAHDKDILKLMPSMTENKAYQLIRDIKAKHPGIAHLFHRDLGIKLQYEDSRIMREVLSRITQVTGRTPIPLHDEIWIPQFDLEEAYKIFSDVLVKHGLRPDLKVKTYTSRIYPSKRYLPALIPAENIKLIDEKVEEGRIVSVWGTSTITAGGELDRNEVDDAPRPSSEDWTAWVKKRLFSKEPRGPE